jgi:enoyl-CoA hydratase/carnithine racemase
MTITLNRVDKKNSITAAMYGAMADALTQAEADPAMRAVVLQGHETVFSAGNDIGDFLNQPPATAESQCVPFPARHRRLFQAADRRRLWARRGRGHHDAVPLRPGLCR